MSTKIINLIFFLDTFQMSLLLPLINPHVMSLGGSLTLVGVLTSLVAAMQLFSSPVIGSWSDTRGRKLLLLCTTTGILVSHVITGINSLPFFILGRVIFGIAHQTDPLVKALIADTVPQEGQLAAYNKLMICACISFICGPILGGYLYELYNNFSFICTCLVAVDLVLLASTYMFLEEKPKPNKDNQKDKKEQQQKSFLQSLSSDLAKIFSNLKGVNWSKYGDLLYTKFYVEASFNLLFMNMGMLLRQLFQFNRTQLGFAVAYLSMTMMVSTILNRIIISKLYAKDTTGFKCISHCFIVMISVFITVPFIIMFAESHILYLSVFFPACLAKTVLDNTWTKILSGRTTESDKGVMMGAGTSMVSLAGLICPLSSGLIADYVGLRSLTLLPIIPAVFGVSLTRRLRKQATEKKEE